MIEPGATAPDFTLPDHGGEQVASPTSAGAQVMLVFYPSDFSPVCSDQLSIYQEVLPRDRRDGRELVGITSTARWAHKAFRKKLGLEIPLLADFHPKGEVARAYGAYLDGLRPRQPLARADRRGGRRAAGSTSRRRRSRSPAPT